MSTASEKIGVLKRTGERVLGCFPLYPPVELFHSMRLTPVVLWGLRDSVKGVSESDKHLQNYCCSISRFLAEFVLSEGRGLLDGLFMYNACDTLRNTPEIDHVDKRKYSGENFFLRIEALIEAIEAKGARRAGRSRHLLPSVDICI